MTDKQFANVPSGKQAAMERCVLKLKNDPNFKPRKGRTRKQAAIAVCFQSVVRGKDLGELIEMTIKDEKRKAKRRERKALKRAKEKTAAGEPLSHEEQTAIAKATFKEEQKISQDEAAAEVVAAIGGETEPIEVGEIGDVLEFERDEKFIHPDEERSSHGPTSFVELDKVREVTEEVNKVQAVLGDAQRLVDNVLHESEPNEVSGKLAAIADELDDRIENPPERKETGILANFKEKVLGGLEKAKLTRAVTKLEDGERLVASDFADVPDRTKPSTWKLRLVENRSGHFTVVQVGRAITAMQSSGFRGQRVKIGTSKGQVVSKISAAINKIKGATDEQKRNLRERLAKVKSSGIEIQKALDGTFRWFGWVSNKYRDRDWPAEPKLGGQILTEEAHKEFVLWVDENPKENMPRLWPWHTLGGQHKERADWIDYADGFLVMSGPLTEKEGELLTDLGKEYDLAMSHGLVSSDKHYDKERGLIQRYRTFEASYLPREFAANEWTDIITIAKEVAEMGFTPEKRTFLERVLGEERIMELEENTEDRAKELDELGVEWKGLEDALAQIDFSTEESEPKEEEETPETEAVPAKEFEGLSDFLEKQTEATEANSKAIVAIGDVLVKLSKSDDEKVAEAIRPKISMKDTKPVWQRSASESKENVIDKDDPSEEDKDLLKSAPGMDDVPEELRWLPQELGAGAAEVAPVPK